MVEMKYIPVEMKYIPSKGPMFLLPKPELALLR